MAKRMTLDELWNALGKLREEHPHLRDMEVYCEDSELGPQYGNSILGVDFDTEGTNLRISTP